MSNNRVFPSLNGSNINRRLFLKHSALAAGGLALGNGLIVRPVLAAEITTFKATHGPGLCNCPFFLVKERGLAKNVLLDFVTTPTNADIAALFGAGLVDVSVVPYTNFITLYARGAPIKIVAGSGVQGCVIVSQKGIDSAEKLRGKTLGTFQADTLEMLPYDYLKMAGMSFADVKVRYFGSSPELAQAFINGNVDAMCNIEPYATQALQACAGAVRLSDGVDIYGKNYSDCVLAVRTSVLADKRDAVKALIKGMMIAQQQEETDPAVAVKETVGKYFKTSYEATLDATSKQPAMIDQRQNQNFILQRAQNLKDLRYIQDVPNADIFDWSLLNEVIKENSDLYASLKLKSV